MPMQDIRLTTNAPLGEDQVHRLEDLGLRLVSRLSENSYRLRGDSGATAADLVGLDFVDTASAYDATDKLDPSLSAASATAATAVADAGAAPLVTGLVSLDPAVDPAVTKEQLAELGDVVTATPRRAVVSTSTDRLADIASLDGVLSVEIEPDPHTQNDVARTLAKVEPIATTLGLDGTGEIVGVADSGLDTGVAATVLADFAGRVVNIRATVVKAPADGADLNNHGTHVSGSILGDGANSNGRLRGMAPGARLTMLSMGPDNSTRLIVPADLVAGVFTDAYADGARIHSNSWGSNNTPGRYTAFSEDVDDFVFHHPDMLVVIAAGNAGPGASTVQAPGTAKNCLTVGASESVRPLPAAISINPNMQDHDHDPATPKTNVPVTRNNFSQQADDADDIADFSGRGPVKDIGDTRTKPDIVAPGTFILSCRSTVSTADVGPDGVRHSADIDALYADDADGVATHAEAVGRGLPGAPFFGTWNQNTPAAPAGSGALAQQNYFYSSGTSMATPITSGTAALLRQYLRERRGVATPSAALMKAMIVNAATVPAGVSTAPDNTRGFGWLDLEQLLSPPPTGQQAIIDDVHLAVATGEVRRLAVQVAAPDLPLRVTLAWTDSPGKGLQNRLYLRLVPPGGGAPIDGDVTAFPNPTNNVQRVHVAAPTAGTWTIEVHGIDVPFGIPTLAPALRQDFALAVSNGTGLSPEPVGISQVIDDSGSIQIAM
ncbi:S8 family serine peptidase [Geodermatophilus sp. SYSU D00779]